MSDEMIESGEKEEELEPGMVAVNGPLNQAPKAPDVLPLAAVKKLVKDKHAKLVARVEMFRPVYAIGDEWYEEVGGIRNGWVMYKRCNEERKAEIQEKYKQVRVR